jgi:hypothetical protein
MNLETRIKIEKRIVRQIVKNALARNWNVSVYDGEEITLLYSKNLTEIIKATFTTDEDVLIFRDAVSKYVGQVALVYGNDGWDVVSDHTWSDVMDEFMAPITELSDRLCLQYA